jgi:hypothetical protein
MFSYQSDKNLESVKIKIIKQFSMICRVCVQLRTVGQYQLVVARKDQLIFLITESYYY